jgi:uncharacterized protein DUF3592
VRQVQLNGSRVCLLFLCAAAVLICAGIYSEVRTARFIDQASLAEGTGIENVAALDTSENHLTYRPRIRFRSGAGEKITITSSLGADRPAYQVGQTVALLYHPNEPTQVEIRGLWSLWLLTVMLSGPGAVFVGIGLAMLGSLLRSNAPSRRLDPRALLIRLRSQACASEEKERFSFAN